MTSTAKTWAKRDAARIQRAKLRNTRSRYRRGRFFNPVGQLINAIRCAWHGF